MFPAWHDMNLHGFWYGITAQHAGEGGPNAACKRALLNRTFLNRFLNLQAQQADGTAQRQQQQQAQARSVQRQQQRRGVAHESRLHPLGLLLFIALDSTAVQLLGCKLQVKNLRRAARQKSPLGLSSAHASFSAPQHSVQANGTPGP